MGKKLDVTNRFTERFAGVDIVKGQREKVAELKGQVKQLESQIQKQNCGKFLVSLDKIRPSDQCRQTFTKETIQKRIRSLEAEGQLDPLVLIPLDNNPGHYMIEDGEVTWRAASILSESKPEKWGKLQSILSNTNDPSTVHFRSFLHHLHSESLNPLDRAESALKVVEYMLNIESEEAIKLLRNICYRMQKGEFSSALSSFLELGEQEALINEQLNPKQIELAKLCYRLQLDLVSFVKNDLGMVSLGEDLKLAIRERELTCNNALAINRLNGKNLPLNDDEIKIVRQEITDFVLSNKLTTAQTRRKVEEVISSYVPEVEDALKASSSEAYNTINSSLKQLSVAHLSKTKLKKLKSSFESQLKKIDSALSD